MEHLKNYRDYRVSKIDKIKDGFISLGMNPETVDALMLQIAYRSIPYGKTLEAFSQLSKAKLNYINVLDMMEEQYDY